MLSFKSIIAKIGLMSLVAVFTQCATGQKLDKTAPVQVTGAYYQKWVAGIKEGGSGINIVIPVDKNSDVKLTEAYFQGKKIKLERKPNDAVFVGNYTNPSKERDLVMSNDPKEEFKNKVPGTESQIPFELKAGECVVAYIKGGKSGFFKIDKLPEKQMEAFPMAPRQ